MMENYIERINMQLLSRLQRIEKENEELKRAIQEFNWLIDLIKNLKIIGGIINETSSKRLNGPQDF